MVEVDKRYLALVHPVNVLIRNGDVWIERIFTGEQVAAGVILPGFAVAVANLWDEHEDHEAANGNSE